MAKVPTQGVQQEKQSKGTLYCILSPLRPRDRVLHKGWATEVTNVEAKGLTGKELSGVLHNCER